jgi:hypothetical protein
MRNRWYLCAAICFVLLFAGTFLIASGFSQQKSTSNAAKKSISTRKSSNSKKTGTSGKSKTTGQQSVSHCGDNPPANPSNCNIDKKFVVGCTLPFQGGVSHDIDEHCPNEGCASRPSDKAQNVVKNNLCATGTPVQISFTSIDKLQQAVDLMVRKHKISYGKNGPPQSSDRPKLHGLSTVDAGGSAARLGEGDLVTLEAFVLDAKHDDTFPFGFAGEGVNCKNSLLEWNDIHVALGQTASSKECSSVTAEIIPHFRPPVWDRFDCDPCTSPHVTKPLPVKGLRVRITGQLFFDGSHLPSSCTKPAGGGNPLRRSVWEIHPVYKIEVFDGSKFISLEDWAATH